MEVLNSDELNHAFSQVLEQLKSGSRPQLLFTEESLSFLVNHWQDLNEQNAPEADYLPLLCLLDHAKKGDLSFVKPLAWTLENRRERDLLVYGLTAAHKVIIEECERLGERIPFDFIKALKVPLRSSEAEVVEWTLRTIEALGHQSIILRDDVVASRPSILGILNQHKKNSRELVDYLLKRWERRL